MVGADANQGCPKSPHLVPEGCHRQQEPFLVKGKPRCARLSFHKRKGFYNASSIETIKMLSSGRKCLNSPNLFCYICGKFTVKDQRMNISEFVQKASSVCFFIMVTNTPLFRSHTLFMPKRVMKK